MKSPETGWREGETLLTTAPEKDGTLAAAPVPALTILAHDDPARVGERLALPALAAGLEIRLSRIEPVFAAPGGGDRARPLADRHLSRRPILLAAGDGPGSVTLDRTGTSTSVVAGGHPVGDAQESSAAEVDRGVVLLLGRRVALLLHRLPLPVPEEPSGFGLVGDSAAVALLRREIRRLAALDVPVLLAGETGTGKELTARALHDAGARRNGPWVAVNMATLPPPLAAAELFGAARGAYTGADRAKTGLFQQARGGTLFLDEIGETPPEVQPMLLRALDSHEIRPVGSAETLTTDVRVVAATDADLEAAITTGNFRAPLYHRLAGYALRLPALRQRRDDVGRLFYHFLAQELESLDDTTWPAAEDERPWPPAELVARLARHHWPGNVRELRNVVRRLVILGRGTAPAVLAAQVEEILAASSAAPSPAAPAPAAPAPAEALEPEKPSPAITAPAPARRRLRKPSDVGDDELLAALEAHSYKLKPAAEALGLSRINLYRLIDGHPEVRKAADLGSEEIEGALARRDGDREAVAAELRVSVQGLKRRMTALCLPRR